MSDTYRDVDAAADVAGAVAWQERVDGWEAVVAYKSRMDELCQGLTPVVDVGAGPGLDARRVGAVAIDRSVAMARRGREHGVPYAIGDAHRLPLAGGAAGAVRCDRVLQHVDDPRDAVAELARCLRPGGRLVVCDPDQSTLHIEIPGAPRVLVDRAEIHRRDVGYRNGTYVALLPDWLGELGFTHLTVEPFVLVLDDPDDAFGIETWPRSWGFSDAECDGWAGTIEASRSAGFSYEVTYVVVSGQSTSE
jgi:SAM-dependent methyltransferase